jgi:cytochrome c oxidase cbb3-type subunit 3/ubiquinol-cytochrome c reductase cytochrome c subunit
MLLVVCLAGCEKHVEEYTRPDQLMNFQALFSENCSACHGAEGKNGAGQTLNDPVFQHLIGPDQLKKNITQGVPGSAMPGFSRMAGGFLTEKQIDVLVNGMQQQWGGAQDTANLPPYSGDQGNVQHGESVYNQYCAGCHGTHGDSGKGGSVIDPRFLQLVSNQSLRTSVIERNPGHNWRSYIAGHAMTADEISDVVAWLASHRQKENL